MSKSFDDRCAAYCDLCKHGIGEIYRVTDKDDNYALQFHPQRWVHMRDEKGWWDCEAADIRESALLTTLLTEAVSMVRDLACEGYSDESRQRRIAAEGAEMIGRCDCFSCAIVGDPARCIRKYWRKPTIEQQAEADEAQNSADYHNETAKLPRGEMS